MFFSVWVLHLGSVILEEGLHFTDGRADVGRGLSMEVFFFLLRDLVSALVEGVECEKQSARQCAAGWGKKQKQEINQIQS